jgi:hypothetical protein
MASLIFHEFRKCFVSKAMLVALALFSAINIAKIYSVYSSESPLSSEPRWQRAYWRLHEEFGGEMTEEKISKLLAAFRLLEQKTADRTATTAMDVPGTFTGNLYSDYHLMNWYFIQPMEYAYMYRKTAAEVSGAAHENIYLFLKMGNDFEARKNAAIEKMFAGRGIGGFYNLEMFQHYTQYNFSILLVLLMALYGTSQVFSRERETDMELILLASRFGGLHTTVAKILSTDIFAFMVSAWFWILDFAAFSMAFPAAEGARAPIYALRAFAYSPLRISIGGYAVLSAASKTMGAIALCMAYLAIASLFQNALLPFIANALLTIGMVICGDALTGSSHVWLKVLSPFTLAVSRELYVKTEFANLAGYPVSSCATAHVAGALWILGLGALIASLTRKNAASKARRDAWRQSVMKRKRCSSISAACCSPYCIWQSAFFRLPFGTSRKTLQLKAAKRNTWSMPACFKANATRKQSRQSRANSSA